MDDLDRKLLEDLSRDSRLTFAELGRKYNLSRVCIRERINNLVEEGVIEKFTIEVNPEKLDKKLTVFFDIKVKPDSLYDVAEELVKEEGVTDVFLLTGSATIYMNTILKNREELEYFLREKIYSREEVLEVNSKILLKWFKNPKGQFGSIYK